MSMESIRRSAALALTSAVLLAPAARAAVHDVRATEVATSREGFDATVQSGHTTFLVRSYVWEMTPPDSILFWMVVTPPYWGTVQPLGQLLAGPSSTRVESMSYGEQGQALFYMTLPKTAVSTARFSVSVVYATLDSSDTFRLDLGTFVGTTPPPIDLAGLTFDVEHVLAETDSTYVVDVSCKLTNRSLQDKRLWVHFLAHSAGFAPDPVKARAYAEREAAREGVVVVDWLVSPWNFISGFVEPGQGFDGPLVLAPGDSRSGTFRIHWNKTGIAEWAPGDLTATIEMEGRRVEDPDTFARTRSLLVGLRVPVPE